MKTTYVKGPAVKRYMKERGLRTSAGFLESLDREVCEMLGKFERTAKADRTKTVMAVHIDLPKTIATLSKDLRRRRTL